MESRRKRSLSITTLACRESKHQGKQTFLQTDQINFKEKLVASFLAANISLHKWNHPAIESVLSFETATQASVAHSGSQKENQT